MNLNRIDRKFHEAAESIAAVCPEGKTFYLPKQDGVDEGSFKFHLLFNKQKPTEDHQFKTIKGIKIVQDGVNYFATPSKLKETKSETDTNLDTNNSQDSEGQ